MQQIKLFKSIDNELQEMEKQINRWIRKTGVRVLSISGNFAASQSTGPGMGSFAGGDVLIIVHYEIDPPTS